MMAAAYGYARAHGKVCAINLHQVCVDSHSSTDYMGTVFRNFPRTEAPPDTVLKEALEGVNSINYTPLRYADGTVLLHGYFQSLHYLEGYLDDFVRQLVLPAVPSRPNAAFVHFRRTDYLTNGILNFDLTTYYARALAALCAHVGGPFTLTVFSDDLSWCRAHPPAVPPQVTVTYVDERDAALSLALMASCELGGVCPNSTFSWWGACLNPNPTKFVTFPSLWFVDCEGRNGVSEDAPWARIIPVE